MELNIEVARINIFIIGLVRYPVWQHTFVSLSAFSRRAVVSYWRKYVHKVLVNRLGGLSLPRKSVVRLTDRPDMTLDVYRGRKTAIQLSLEFIANVKCKYLEQNYCSILEEIWLLSDDIRRLSIDSPYHHTRAWNSIILVFFPICSLSMIRGLFCLPNSI